MTINLSNYEAWFLDYHEGNLDAACREALFSFLEMHPELREEFDSFDAVTLEAPEVKFPGKRELFRADDAGFGPAVFIAWHEGDLDAERKKNVEAWLQKNPGQRKDFEMYGKLKLLPDYTIVFQGKKDLKKTTRLFPAVPALYRYAAALAMLVATYFYFRDVPRDAEVVAVVEEPVRSAKPAPETESPAVRQEVRTNPPLSTVIPSSKPGKIKVPAPKNEKELPKVKLGSLQVLVPLQPQPLPESMPDSPVIAAAPVTSSKGLTQEQLLEIFTPEELEEMGLAEAETKRKSVWDLVEKGAEEVGKVTGSDVSVTRRHDEEERTKSYRFAIGGFSVSHKRAE